MLAGSLPEPGGMKGIGSGRQMIVVTLIRGVLIVE